MPAEDLFPRPAELRGDHARAHLVGRELAREDESPAELARVPAPGALSARERERVYLDENAGRQVLHVTFGSVLTMGQQRNGRSFKEGILETLHAHVDLHRQVLSDHLGKHIRLLSAG